MVETFFGCDDERLGEIVGVAVVPRAGCVVTLDDVIAHLRRRQVAIYKMPQRHCCCSTRCRAMR